MTMRVSHSAAPAAGDEIVLLRRTLGHFATGVAVVSYAAEDGPRGLTVNSFASVSLDPPLILVCIDKRSRSVERLSASPFAVNILNAEQRALALLFAGKAPPTTSVQWREIGGVPLLTESLAWFVCGPWASHDAGDHIVFIARVVDYGSAANDPLCFFRGAFLDVAQLAPQLTGKEGGT